MKSEEEDRALKTPAEANRDKHVNYFAEEDTEGGKCSDSEENSESYDRARDGDGGHDGSSNEMLQKEKSIDPGNEHHHSGEGDLLFNENDNQSLTYDTDADGDGPEQVEDKK